MLVYDFIFTAADYSGTTAHIYGLGGAEIAESPVTIDASGRFSLSLAEGIYYAVTSSPARGLNNAQAQGVLNMPASIAAGGGGVSLDESRLTFEVNEGATLDVNGGFGNLTWDTAPDGFTPGFDLAIPPGLYLAQLYLDLGTFTDDLVAGLAIGQDVTAQPIALIAAAPFTRTIQVTGVIRSREGIAITASAGFALAGAGDTETVDVSYASLILTPFTPPVD